MLDLWERLSDVRTKHSDAAVRIEANNLLRDQLRNLPDEMPMMNRYGFEYRIDMNQKVEQAVYSLAKITDLEIDSQPS